MALSGKIASHWVKGWLQVMISDRRSYDWEISSNSTLVSA